MQSPFLLQAIQFFTSLVRLNAILQRTGEAALAIFASGLLWFLTRAGGIAAFLGGSAFFFDEAAFGGAARRL